MYRNIRLIMRSVDSIDNKFNDFLNYDRNIEYFEKN